MNWGATATGLWVVWGLMFVVVETIALCTDLPGDTLSEHVRKWFSVKTKLGRTIFLVVWAGFAIWFAPHILLGW